jgi:hypothetical protein
MLNGLENVPELRRRIGIIRMMISIATTTNRASTVLAAGVKMPRLGVQPADLALHALARWMKTASGASGVINRQAYDKREVMKTDQC